MRTAHVIFVRAADAERPLLFAVDVVHEGRTFASAIVRVIQGDRQCASVTVLLDTEQESVIAHASPMPDVGSPAAAMPVDMPMVGRELRLVGLADPNDPDEDGEPIIDAWLHYDEATGPRRTWPKR